MLKLYDSGPPTAAVRVPGAVDKTVRKTVTVAVDADDDYLVSKVELFLDGTRVAILNEAPYLWSWDTTLGPNGIRTLHARVTDAAGKQATSSPRTLEVRNCLDTLDRLQNGGFEQGAVGWTAPTGVISNKSIATFSARSGSYRAWLGGRGISHKQVVWQQVTVPADACSAKLRFFVRVNSAETTSQVRDVLRVQVRDASGTVLQRTALFTNLHHGPGWTKSVFDLSAYRGQTLRIAFVAVEDGARATSFFVDDVAVLAVR